MTAQRHVTFRLVGATLIVGSLVGWFLIASPWSGDTDFGSAPPDPTGAVIAQAPSDAAAAAPDPAAPSGSAPDAASDPEPTPEPPPFTTTAPRGAIDRATWPAAVIIPSLGVDAPVQMVGVGSEGALIVPHSPMDVGWYQGGAVPGEPGVALLTSHVDTRTEGRGVFAGLIDLRQGERVTLLTADGLEQHWTITARTQHLKSELPPGLFARSGEPVLALVTCGGPFDREFRSYRDNVIVWAELTS
jgi:sortase (surface protein transpeptidase)